MAVVIPFPVRASDEDDETEIDLLTAVDVAIRDLREIASRADAHARRQADECREMLERAFANAVQCQG
ncbi:MAG TPA: hypothetical protein VFB16_02465 [Bauldia sp.]|nr:hypothetical protein [Bauldia sp.]